VQRVPAVAAQVGPLGTGKDEHVQSGLTDNRAYRVHAGAAVLSDGGEETEAEAVLVKLSAADRGESRLLPFEMCPGDHEVVRYGGNADTCCQRFRDTVDDVRADRLVSLALLLQARGRMSAHELAGELEVSVRTVYRDISALNAAGIPVMTEPGPGGGCRLIEGYRFPLRGLSADEAEALLLLGVPAAVAELGLADALAAAHRKVRTTAGLGAGSGGSRQASLVHLDMPRWFHGTEPVPHLRTLAEAVRLGRCVLLGYRRDDGARQTSGPEKTREIAPLGLVNKAGTWYLVAIRRPRREPQTESRTSLQIMKYPACRGAPVPDMPDAAQREHWAGRREDLAGQREDLAGQRERPASQYGDRADQGEDPAGRREDQASQGGDQADGRGEPAVFRAGRVTSVRLLSAAVVRPDGFDLAAFWERWSAAFVTSRSQVEVRVRATATALGIFPYVFGDAGKRATEAAGPADADGLREVMLTFEEERAAVHRLAGFGGEVAVISPEAVRTELIATAWKLLARYDQLPSYQGTTAPPTT
jgi:predicted DNA-binding transcriptional regulator YafY